MTWSGLSTTINSTVIFIVPSNGTRCSEDDNIGVPTPVYVILVVLDAITVLIAVAIIMLHLLIKELLTVSGILIMMLCGSLVLSTIVTFASLTYGYIAEEEQNNSVCIALVNLSFYMLFVYQAIKLGILFHFTYLMYKSFKAISSDETENKQCTLIKYSTFVLVASILCFVFVILFELAGTGEVYSTGGGSFCFNANADVGGDNAVIFSGIASLVVITFIASEIAMFSIGLLLYFLANRRKCCKTISGSVRVAIALAATVGINMILFISLRIARVSGELFLPSLTSATVAELLILFVVFLSSHKAWTKTKVTLSRSISRLHMSGYKDTQV